MRAQGRRPPSSKEVARLPRDDALRDGLPIATEATEGACRYVVKDHSRSDRRDHWSDRNDHDRDPGGGDDARRRRSPTPRRRKPHAERHGRRCPVFIDNLAFGRTAAAHARARRPDAGSAGPPAEARQVVRRGHLVGGSAVACSASAQTSRRRRDRARSRRVQFGSPG